MQIVNVSTPRDATSRLYQVMEVHRGSIRAVETAGSPLMTPDCTEVAVYAAAWLGLEAGMKLGYDGRRLRIFVHESLRHQGRPVYECIVEQARRQGLAGATVFRGIEGFGLHRHVHTTRLTDASDDLPIIVEIVDRPDAIARLLPTLDDLLVHGTVTVSPVEIVKYAAGGGQ